MRIMLYFFTFFGVCCLRCSEVENVTFGFSGGYKTGTWAPLTITVRSQDEPVVIYRELVVEVQNFSSDTPLERYTTPLRLSPTGRQQKSFYVYCSKNAARLVVQLLPSTSVESNLLHGVGGFITPIPPKRCHYRYLLHAKIISC